ncbi:MAG: hypothetical protein KGM43_03835 [Planctomycetota bacterium]|nr:hypothetical protein [Planctomycetota bacterium]
MNESRPGTIARSLGARAGPALALIRPRSGVRRNLRASAQISSRIGLPASTRRIGRPSGVSN